MDAFPQLFHSSVARILSFLMHTSTPSVLPQAAVNQILPSPDRDKIAFVVNVRLVIEF